MYLRLVTALFVCVCSMYSADAQSPIVGTDISFPIIQETNKWRSRNQAAPLTFDQDAANWAQNWANFLSSNPPSSSPAFKGNYPHNPNSIAQGYGENIWNQQNIVHVDLSKKPADYGASEWWYSECSCYPGRFYPIPKNQPNSLGYKLFEKYGHFTQIVWASTKAVGCGSVIDAKGIYWIVCNYSPGGNLPGTYYKNVFQPYGINCTITPPKACPEARKIEEQDLESGAELTASGDGTRAVPRPSPTPPSPSPAPPSPSPAPPSPSSGSSEIGDTIGSVSDTVESVANDVAPIADSVGSYATDAVSDAFDEVPNFGNEADSSE